VDIILGKLDNGAVLPGAFMFLPDKEVATYRKVLTIIKENLHSTARLQQATLDFERAVMRSFATLFPTVKVIFYI
jgi:hypothetical protein